MYQLLLFISLYAQPLTWADYKATPDKNSVLMGKVAFTVTEWTIDETVDNGRVYFNISQRFVPESSWTITNSESVLRHEQVHFLISKLWLDKCIKKISKYNGTSEKNRTRAYITYNHCWKEYRLLQALFDKETDEGTRPNMERKWEEQIAQSATKQE
jgi:hypothetical protein